MNTRVHDLVERRKWCYDLIVVAQGLIGALELIVVCRISWATLHYVAARWIPG